MKKIAIKYIACIVTTILTISGWLPVVGSIIKENDYSDSSNIKYIEKSFTFSFPEIVPYKDSYVIRIAETDLNRMDPANPVLPVNLSVFELQFGSEIIDVNYIHSSPWIFTLPSNLVFGLNPGIDKAIIPISKPHITTNGLEESDLYPNDWVSYETGGGLVDNLHKTILSFRVYPVRYQETTRQLQFIQQINLNISYKEPVNSLLPNYSVYDLLIIAPSEFIKNLEPLRDHKNSYDVNTKLVSLNEVYEKMYWQGRDNAEKIKYFIKSSVENWGVKYVLLVSGIKGQSTEWNLPARYSHVVPPEEQEYPEASFLSDLYYADIYDGAGEFSSWDSNGDNIFAVWNGTFKDDMDVYPDVYLGRLPCRNIAEVKIMVDKIINYESTPSKNKQWFKNLLLVGGDSYVEEAQINEGELICNEAILKMPGFNPVKAYASQNDINRQTVNNAMNKGSGFAYFCGHGSDVSWNTHFFPANDTNWCSGYSIIDMIFLKNKYKLPVTIVGGCHNGQFDISIMKSITKGLEKKGLKYFLPSSRFWYDGWAPNCWAWWLTSKIGGGAIATIANTGLGTHGDGDIDNNSIADYLEVLDGWLELRFLELYGKENKDFLGENHCQTITEYLNRFIG
ncbi:MAG: hypothetical protein JXA91_04025, partial [Candidatus Thermoplasmatota archaeon]|nr:hypothetical protein [Candidatus Thermoplasmatota archaeon]